MNATAQQGSTNTFALALVVLINWMLAHLETDWAMPPEVQSSLQAIIAIVVTWIVTKGWRRPPTPEIPHA